MTGRHGEWDARDAEGERVLVVARQVVRAAEEMVSSAWLMHVLEMERDLETALRVARHVRDGARVSVRFARRSGEPGSAAEAQRRLEEAQRDFASCFEMHRRVRALARHEGECFAAASRARTSGALADQARIEALLSVVRREGEE